MNDTLIFRYILSAALIALVAAAVVYGQKTFKEDLFQTSRNNFV